MIEGVFTEMYGIDVSDWSILREDERLAFYDFVYSRADEATAIATTPRIIKENASIVSCGHNHTLLVTRDGALWHVAVTILANLATASESGAVNL